MFIPKLTARALRTTGAADGHSSTRSQTTKESTIKSVGASNMRPLTNGKKLTVKKKLSQRVRKALQHHRKADASPSAKKTSSRASSWAQSVKKTFTSTRAQTDEKKEKKWVEQNAKAVDADLDDLIASVTISESGDSAKTKSPTGWTAAMRKIFSRAEAQKQDDLSAFDELLFSMKDELSDSLNVSIEELLELDTDTASTSSAAPSSKPFTSPAAPKLTKKQKRSLYQQQKLNLYSQKKEIIKELDQCLKLLQAFEEGMEEKRTEIDGIVAQIEVLLTRDPKSPNLVTLRSELSDAEAWLVQANFQHEVVAELVAKLESLKSAKRLLKAESPSRLTRTAAKAKLRFKKK